MSNEERLCRVIDGGQLRRGLTSAADERRYHVRGYFGRRQRSGSGAAAAGMRWWLIGSGSGGTAGAEQRWWISSGDNWAVAAGMQRGGGM